MGTIERLAEQLRDVAHQLDAAGKRWTANDAYVAERHQEIRRLESRVCVLEAELEQANGRLRRLSVKRRRPARRKKAKR